MRAHKSFFLILIFWASLGEAFAQKTLYLDAQVGGGYFFAEGAHLGLGRRPLKGHNFLIEYFVAPMLRLQFNESNGISLGYSGGGLGWGYKLQVPKSASHSIYGGGYAGRAVSVYVDRLPILFNHRLTQFNIKEITSDPELYLFSVKLDAFAGGGLNYVRGFCETCKLGAGLVSPIDTIIFTQKPFITQNWGGYVTAGIIARIFHLGKEKFSVTLFSNQGLTTMMKVPVNYSYNNVNGSVVMRVTGSGVGLLAAVPIRLKTFRKHLSSTQ